MPKQWSPRTWHGVPGFISWPSTTPAAQPSQHAVHSPHARPCAAAIGITAPQHFLYFLPLPQGQGSLRPGDMATTDFRRRSSILGASLQLAFLHRNTGLVIVYLAVLCSLLQSISMRGAKMVVSLSALSLGATPFQVGILASLFAA